MLKQLIANLEAINPFLLSGIFMSANDPVPMNDNLRVIRRLAEDIAQSSVILPLTVLIMSPLQLVQQRATLTSRPTSHVRLREYGPQPPRMTNGIELRMSTTEDDRVAPNEQPTGWFLGETKHHCESYRSMQLWFLSISLKVPLNALRWSPAGYWEIARTIGNPLPKGTKVYVERESLTCKGTIHEHAQKLCETTNICQGYRYRRVIVVSDRRIGCKSCFVSFCTDRLIQFICRLREKSALYHQCEFDTILTAFRLSEILYCFWYT